LTEASFASGRRLRGRRAFSEAFRQGIRVTGASMTLIFQPKTAQPLRPGVVVSGRVRPHVRRTLLKRRLRELVRLHGVLLPSGGSLVILYRGDPARPFEALHRDYLRMLGSLSRCCPA
jgi:ribonuclease P protein component